MSDQSKYLVKGAQFSDCGKYRYMLNRVWDRSKPAIMCIGLNPSTANADTDDQTITNLVGILKNNGYGSLYMMNLFALISPHPDDLRTTPDPVKDNDIWLDRVSKMCEDVLFCWGSFPQAEYRAKKIIRQFPKAKCLGRNLNKSPKHPLYKKQTTKIIPYA